MPRQHVSPTGWFVLLWVAGVFVLGNALQVTPLSRANAAPITSLMPLRLVSALALAEWLLEEHLRTP